MTTIVLADDAVLLRTGLAHLLAEAGLDVVGTAGDASGLHRLVAEHRPDLAIVDIRMPPSHTDEGVRAALSLRRDHPRVGILLLSQYVETADVLTVVRGNGERGTGYLLKERIASVDQFIADVRTVAGGGTVIDPLVAERLMRRRGPSGWDQLTAREREILAEMATGRSNAAIAGELGMTERTVEAHVRSVFAKLGLPTGPEANRRVLAVLSHLAARG
jgi:DNA-binding NarL/FixJ family response regulator